MAIIYDCFFYKRKRLCYNEQLRARVAFCTFERVLNSVCSFSTSLNRVRSSKKMKEHYNKRSTIKIVIPEI